MKFLNIPHMPMIILIQICFSTLLISGNRNVGGYYGVRWLQVEFFRVRNDKSVITYTYSTSEEQRHSTGK